MSEQMTLPISGEQDLYIKNGDPRGILDLPDGAIFSLNTVCHFPGVQMSGGNMVRKVGVNPRTGAVDLELMQWKQVPPDYEGETFHRLKETWKRFTLGKQGEDILTLERVCGIGIGAKE